MRIAVSVRDIGKLCLLRFIIVSLLLAIPSHVMAVDCADIFPDGLQNANSSGSLIFNAGAKLINSPDNILETMNLTDNAGSNISCNGVSCTASNSIASSATWSSFPDGAKIQVSGSQTLSPGDYRSIEVYSSGTITLQPGDYTVARFWKSYSDSNVVVSGSGTVRIYVQNNVSLFSGVNINGSDSADRLFMFASGNIDMFSSVVVNGFLVAEGDITTSCDVVIEGAITATQNIDLGCSATVTFDQSALDSTDFDTYCTRAAATLDHFSISHDGTAVNCQAENVTISAHDSSDIVDTSYVGTITLSTSLSHGDWSLVSGAGVLTNSGNGAGTYAFDAADSGVVVLGLKDTFTETTNINVTNGTASEGSGEDPDLVYASAGFIFLAGATKNAIGTQIGGKASNLAPGAQTLELQAVRTSDDTGACEAALTGTNAVELAFECENPTSCTARQVSISGTDIAGNPNGSVSSYTGVSLDFGDATDTTATFTFSYPDVGQLQLHARLVLSPSTESLTGASNSLVVRPFAFDVSASGNPGATGAGGAVFTTAGTSFTANAEAVLWSAADDADSDGIADGHNDLNPANNADLTDNTAALNYGQEIAMETVALAASLVQPSAGNDPGLQGGTSITSFSSGSGSSATSYYAEVGIAELSATVSDGNFLGIGSTETNKIVGHSSHVGRFTPYDFGVGYNTPTFDEGCAIGAYTYVGQSFDFGTAPVITVTARSQQGTTTQNYTGTWWKIDNVSLVNRSYTAAPPTLDTTGLPSTASDPVVADLGSGTGTLTFGTTSGLLFTRSAPLAPFDAEISLSIDVLDTDGIALPGNPAVFGDASAGNGMAFAVDKLMRYGRIILENAHDSELAALPMQLHTQYYNGVAFEYHSNDSCSDVPPAVLALTKNPSGMPTTPTIANQPLMLGDAGLSLSAPGIGNDGTVDIVVDLSDATGAGLPWLQYDWPSDGNTDGVPDDNPVGRATFGIYRGNDRIIYIREVY